MYGAMKDMEDIKQLGQHGGKGRGNNSLTFLPLVRNITWYITMEESGIRCSVSILSVNI